MISPIVRSYRPLPCDSRRLLWLKMACPHTLYFDRVYRHRKHAKNEPCEVGEITRRPEKSVNRLAF